VADTAAREAPPEIVVDSTAHRLAPALVLGAAIVLAPLPFGSAHGLALSLLQAVLLSAAGLLLAFEGSGRVRRELGPLLAPAAVFAGVCLLQMVPLPASLLRWASPTAAALYERMTDTPARWLPASVNAHASLLSAVRLLSLAGAFAVAAVAPLPGRRSLLYWAILASGAIAAALSWWHVAAGWDTRLFGEFGGYQASATMGRLHWPLLNPNHLAAAMNVTAIVALGAFLAPELLGARRTSPESHLHRTIALVVAILAASATIGTYSRGGMGSGAAGLAVLAFLWPAGRGRPRTALFALRTIGALGAVVAVAWLAEKALTGVDSPSVLAALARRDATLQVRLEVVRQGSRMLADFPLLGTGLGTWGDAFPRYQRYPLLFAMVTHAHCDPLEWLTDLGALGFAAILAGGAVVARRAIAVRDDDARRRRAVLAAALASLLVHAGGEFALRVPAIALAGATMLGLLWRESGRGTAAPVAASDAEPGRPLRPLDAMVAVVCWAAVVYSSTWEWRDERLLGRLAAKEAVPAPATADWRVLEGLSRRLITSGRPGVDPALRAVRSAPFSARSHHALAYSYESDLMRERELRRTVACEPATRFWRLEHALSLAALGRFALARKEIEEGFYFDPQFGDTHWLRFEDPIDGTWPFLEAALRGVRRRAAESPDVAGALRPFEALERQLRETKERRAHGR
jgi:O-antigen ligase